MNNSVWNWKLHDICPICEIVTVYRKSESGLIGACAKCRDKLIPKHIPHTQHKQFLDKLHRKIHDTEKRSTKKYT